MKVGVSFTGLMREKSWERVLRYSLNDNDIDVFTFDPYEKKSMDYLPSMDFFIFDGGADISPHLYNEENKGFSRTNPGRDTIENMLFTRLTELAPNTNLVGICRGQQFLNVMLGGTLFQDLSSINCSHSLTHKVRICNPSNRLTNYISNGVFTVNSYHHQAVKDLGRNLIATILDTSYSIIEGIESRDGKIRAVQSHPEMWRGKNYVEAENIIKYLFRRAENEE